MATMKEQLEKTLLDAKSHKMDICIEVTIPGTKSTELIINRCENIDNKLAYYLAAYDNDLVHKNNEEVKIVGFSMMQYF